MFHTHVHECSEQDGRVEDLEQRLVDNDEDVDRSLAQLLIGHVHVDERLHQCAPEQRQGKDGHLRQCYKSFKFLSENATINKAVVRKQHSCPFKWPICRFWQLNVVIKAPKHLKVFICPRNSAPKII